jgi:hypothetical protein
MSISNGTATKEKEVAQAKNTTIPVKVETPKMKSQGEIIKERMDKRTKLNALYADIDQLETALRDFDSIQQYADVKVVVLSGRDPKFQTTRQDTVNDALTCIQKSINNKLTKAQQDLANFEF